MHRTSLRASCDKHLEPREETPSESRANAPLEAKELGRGEIADSTGIDALGARDIVCKHYFRQIVEIVTECLLCDRKRVRLPERKPEETEKG